MTDGKGLWIVDRFEGEVAVLQETATKAMRDVPRSDLPDGTREGSALRLRDGDWVPDADAERERAERIRRLMDGLFGP